MTISAQEYAQRRQKFLDKIGNNGVAIIAAAAEQHRSADGHFPFRQNSDFYYLTGFNEPDAVAVLIPGYAKGNFILFNRPRDPLLELWHGRRAGQEGACKTYGANQAYPINQLAEILPDLLVNRDTLYFAVGRNANFDQQVFNAVNNIRSKVRTGVAAPSTIINIESIIHELRLFKSPAEIDVMRRAAQISAEGHRRAMKICRPGLHEYQLEAELLHEFFAGGCRSAAYNSIVGGGENTCILHYHENNAVLNDGELVLIDAGGELDCYSADITRTFPVNGRFSDEQKAIYDCVLAAQLAGIDPVRPGTPWPNIQQTMVRIITEGLVKLGLLKGTVDQLITDKAYQAFYMHNSGHWLGLDTHDVGAYQVKGEWRLLEAGMVLTVEPGIYIAANSPGVDKKWWNIGVRIEDDVLVTKDGHDILSAGLAKTVTEIETLMKSRT